METIIKDKNVYKQTEKRLYRVAILCRRIKEHQSDIKELEDMNFNALQHSSKSFVSLIKTGMRIDPLDACEAQIAALKQYIAADEYEVRQVKRALRYVYNDPYYKIIEYKYFLNMTEASIANKMICSLSTVRRNKTRLVRRICEALYGMSNPQDLVQKEKQA